MNLNKTLFLLLIAVPHVSLGEPNWQSEFKNLCQHDKRCELLIKKTSISLDWVSVPLAVKKSLCQKKSEIISAGLALNVSPVLITSCLISEHTFLVNKYDQWTDWFAYYKINLSSDPSIGIAQIKVSTARSIRPQIAHLLPETENIVEELLDTKLAFLYMAALLSQYDKVYTQNSLAVDTGILCSLYLTGKVDEKASTHLKEQTQPRPNYYGFFSALKQSVAESIIESPCDTLTELD